MDSQHIDWRRGIDRLFVVLWAVWIVVLLGMLLLAGPGGANGIVGLGVFFIAGGVVPALLRWALFWVIDGFSPRRGA